jgi:dihydrofolate synthase / folylpolyglutamate synthase
LQSLESGEGQPAVLVDGAHNADSAEKLAHYLQSACQYHRLFLILGITADKNVTGILRPLLPLAAQTIVTKADNPRATTPELLQDRAAELGYDVTVAEDIESAMIQAWQMARPSDLLCVSGSLYIVGDLLNCWDGLQSRLLRG